VFHLASGSTQGLKDAESFVDEIVHAGDHAEPLGRGFFAPDRPIVVARAPGRLDVMGGIADYSGSLVLQWPLREAALVAAQRDPSRLVRVVSLGGDVSRRSPVFETSLDVLAPGRRPLRYDEALTLFRRDSETAWAAYAVGALLVLMRERGVPFLEGVRLFVRSSVPEGKGVSSSAALEVAVMNAVAGTCAVPLDPRELALLCQTVENRVVGAPCGVMDQMTSACGRADALLALLCQPAELVGHTALPEGIELFGLDSGEVHAVSGSDYTGVRVGAFMGLRILAEIEGMPARDGPELGRVEIDDPRFGGYLANVTPSELEAFRDRLPERLSGATFLERYRGTTDEVVRVEAARTYAVRTPTVHPILEHFRVQTFRELLAPPLTEDRLTLLGELMYQSHASYGACGLGSQETDRLVELVRRAGPDRGFYGAKITGGGSGGTVAVLARRGADIEAIATAFAETTSKRPYIFRGSSPGAAAFGHLVLQPA
jgi:L-arabinokinase